MNPLIGGLPVEVGWSSLRLLAEEVLPRVADIPDSATTKP